MVCGCACVCACVLQGHIVQSNRAWWPIQLLNRVSGGVRREKGHTAGSCAAAWPQMPVLQPAAADQRSILHLNLSPTMKPYFACCNTQTVGQHSRAESCCTAHVLTWAGSCAAVCEGWVEPNSKPLNPLTNLCALRHVLSACWLQWLSMRLELTGGVVVFAAAVAVGVVAPRNAGLAGLALTSALNLTGGWGRQVFPPGLRCITLPTPGT